MPLRRRFRTWARFAPAGGVFALAALIVAPAALLAGGVVAAARAEPTVQAAEGSQAPMRFIRVRSGDPACRRDCPEWIAAQGKIVRGTADALARVLAGLGDRRLPIFIDSGGGSVIDAMAMGRLIRAKRLAVVVAHTAIAPCPASAKTCGEARGTAQSWGAYCASACTLVLAGGTERYVSPLSLVGVHQLTELVVTTEIKRSYAVRYFALAGLKFELSRKLVAERRSTSETKKAADRGVDDSVARYLQDMGVLDPVMKLTLTTPAKEIHWLTAEELKDSRLATIWVDGVSPVENDVGASGVRGEPIDPQSGAESVFAATIASPLERPVAGRPIELDASFVYRRGGAAVLASFVARDSDDGKPVDLHSGGLFMILYPAGAELRAAKPAADGPMRMAIPIHDFCRMAHGENAVVSFIEPADAGAAAPPHEPPVTLDPFGADDAALLFDEACPQRTSASR
jgi:hypothetical protein